MLMVVLGQSANLHSERIALHPAFWLGSKVVTEGGPAVPHVTMSQSDTSSALP